MTGYDCGDLITTKTSSVVSMEDVTDRLKVRLRRLPMSVESFHTLDGIWGTRPG